MNLAVCSRQHDENINGIHFDGLKIIEVVCLFVFSLGQTSIEDTIIANVLHLLKREMFDNVKALAQYFQFFITYASYGRYEVSFTNYQIVQFV